MSDGQFLKSLKINLMIDYKPIEEETQPLETLLEEIINYYHSFEKLYEVVTVNSDSNNTPVNFKLAKEFPRHRWYTYKEGFSPVFVSDFINRFNSGKNNVVFDPFGGIGTTVLESSLLGHKSFSNDINPLANYISRIKNDLYTRKDLEGIKEVRHKFQLEDLSIKKEAPDNETIRRYFSDLVFNNILKIQAWIDKVENDKAKNLFNLSLITLLEVLSTHKKDGNGVKKRSNYKGDTTLDDLKNLMSEKIDLFITDIEKCDIIVSPGINSQSSFSSYQLKEKADLVITSPPYANCFDYSKIYMIELWLGGFFKKKDDQKLFRDQSITSHVHYKWEKRHREFGHPLINKEISSFLSGKKLWNKRIPQMLVGYFSDIGKVLEEMKDNLNDGATIGIVVGNSVYAGLPIATDILISEMAQDLGYEFIRIEKYRNLSPSSQQMKIIKEEHKSFLRESLIILKWN